MTEGHIYKGKSDCPNLVDFARFGTVLLYTKQNVHTNILEVSLRMWYFGIEVMDDDDPIGQVFSRC